MLCLMSKSPRTTLVAAVALIFLVAAVALYGILRFAAPETQIPGLGRIAGFDTKDGPGGDKKPTTAAPASHMLCPGPDEPIEVINKKCLSDTGSCARDLGRLLQGEGKLAAGQFISQIELAKPEDAGSAAAPIWHIVTGSTANRQLIAYRYSSCTGVLERREAW